MGIGDTGALTAPGTPPDYERADTYGSPLGLFSVAFALRTIVALVALF